MIIGGLVGVWAQDTAAIDPRRRLRPYELARKREGWVILGYPTVGYDPLRSFGAAIAASIAYNGKRTERTFAYAPYKHYLFFQGGGYLRESLYFRLLYDKPWIAERPYRLTFRLQYRSESQGQLWGVGETYLNQRLPASSLSAYEKYLTEPRLSPEGTWQTNLARHNFYIQQWQSWLVVERTALRGLLRYMGGMRWTSEKLSSLAGKTYSLTLSSGEKVSTQQKPTLLDSIAERLLPSPANLQVKIGSWQHRLLAGGAIIWDTRDFEISPTHGWLIELSHEMAIYPCQTHRTSLSLRNYHEWYQTPSEKFQVTGALHCLISAIYGGNLPLTEMQIYSRWADARLPNLLSGPSTVRAFRENRFLTPTAYLLQYELRSRIAEVRIFKQHFVGGPILFMDAAAGRDYLALPRWQGVVAGFGSGMRILWNMTTVLRADFAYGREGWQLHFTTMHPF